MNSTLNEIKNEIINLIDKRKYNEASKLFADFVGLTMKVDFLENKKHFVDDKDTRDIYTITLIRGSRKYTFEFGQSVGNSGFYAKRPTLYDVLACLQKYDVGSFEDFCSDFGYDIDSRKSKKTYKAVVKEYESMCTLFSDEELEVLSEIT